MIEKLYKLKKNQTDQKLIQKATLEQEVDKIDSEVVFTQHKIDTATVDRFGAISDFLILAMHKDTMRLHIQKLLNRKNSLVSQIVNLVNEIVELQKEAEQFAYILEEEKKERMKKILSAEEEEASEYIQSKYISKQKGFI